MANERWRVLPYHRGPAALHIALSDALVRLVDTPTLWWHATDVPTLILGAGQSTQTMSADLAAGTVRRHAGGTAVLATTDVLGLDVALPHVHGLAVADVVEAYRWLGETWVETLQGVGVDARLVSIAESRAQVPSPRLEPLLRQACFGTLSPYEVVADSRKLVGLAQVRRQRGILLQAGLHLSFDAFALAFALTSSMAAELSEALKERAIGLDEVLDELPPVETIMRTFEHTVARRLEVELVCGEWSDSELGRAEVDRASL